jgi:hypothetical protein
MKRYILFCNTLLSVVVLTSCEKVIPVKLDKGVSQLTVDAFLDDQPGTQKIRLTKTGGYFDNVPNPAATGATVKVTDDLGHNYIFVDNSNSGDYLWIPLPSDTLVRVFSTYTLSVKYAGEEFQATSIAFPTTVIDSVTYKPKKNASGKITSTTAFTASFYAKDIAGMTNFYWIKSYKNGIFYSKPANINLAQDGAFPGGGTDGLTFILPIREAIIPQGDSIARGDSITVKLYSITPQTYFYLNEVVEQTTNSGLFATPPSNVSTNINNVNISSSTKAVGFFNIGQVSIGGVKVK